MAIGLPVRCWEGAALVEAPVLGGAVLTMVGAEALAGADLAILGKRSSIYNST